MPPSLTQRLFPIDIHLQRKIQFSLRESHWGNQQLIGRLHAHQQMVNKKMNSNASLKFSCFIMFSQEILFLNFFSIFTYIYLTDFVNVLRLPGLCFYRISECVSVSLHPYLFLVPFLGLFSICLFCPIPICFLFLYFPTISQVSFLFSKEKENGDGSCLFANQRQKGCMQMGGVGRRIWKEQREGKL